MFLSRTIWYFACMLVVMPLFVLFAELGVPGGLSIALAFIVAAFVVAFGVWITGRDGGETLKVNLSLFVLIVAGTWLTFQAFGLWGARPITFAIPISLFVILSVGTVTVLAGEKAGVLGLVAITCVLGPIWALMIGIELGYPSGPWALVAAITLTYRLKRGAPTGPGAVDHANTVYFVAALILLLATDFLIAPALADAWGWNIILMWVLTLPVLVLLLGFPLTLLIDPKDTAASWRKGKAEGAAQRAAATAPPTQQQP
ncbi:hypothetical protein [Kibdelosporangium phytohabitans]|uniref:Uncharacterized protein n=1 Tax=Kibdelosporangium phytohabitans TaxID=860235 RepID=A0A0N9I5K7_9PSEU|nr:hypothetical protein [Kibdelosporangium phytohabitans]ALG10156.1 hypothetical protein AOZ06_27560 [Kibdelosporangium phytohabitans]MBE1461153.1 hypothetical protein [Kibdelosporangium phytohabitans]